jgi:hypothetical protein
MPVKRLAPSKVADFFRSFYNGFKDDATIWFGSSGPDADQFERPYFLKFDRVCDLEDVSKKAFQVAITPCLLQANFSFGRGEAKLSSYEFYHPSVAA